MLAQASIHQIRQGEVARPQNYVVVCMAHYPRGLKKELIDEYRVNLAPDKKLFTEWKTAEEKEGHEKAFAITHYEQRFVLTAEGLESLRRLVDISGKQNVVLACQCEIGERCHREMLLLTAQKLFGAQIDTVYKTYPEFSARLQANAIRAPGK